MPDKTTLILTWLRMAPSLLLCTLFVTFRDFLHFVIMTAHDKFDAWKCFEGKKCYDKAAWMGPKFLYGNIKNEFYRFMVPIGVKKAVSQEILSGKEFLDINVEKVNQSISKTPMVYFHGGGWVSVECSMIGMFGTQLGQERVLIAANYPLTPESRYPQAFRSALKLLRHLKKQHNCKRIIVSGDSAGANLAVMACAFLHNLSMRIGMRRRHSLCELECALDLYPEVESCLGICGVYEREICEPFSLSSLVSFALECRGPQTADFNNLFLSGHCI